MNFAAPCRLRKGKGLEKQVKIGKTGFEEAAKADRAAEKIKPTAEESSLMKKKSKKIPKRKPKQEPNPGSESSKEDRESQETPERTGQWVDENGYIQGKAPERPVSPTRHVTVNDTGTGQDSVRIGAHHTVGDAGAGDDSLESTLEMDTRDYMKRLKAAKRLSKDARSRIPVGSWQDVIAYFRKQPDPLDRLAQYSKTSLRRELKRLNWHYEQDADIWFRPRE